MKEAYPLPDLLRKMEMSRSNYYYQAKLLSRKDKYRHLREGTIRIFKDNKGGYGYRRIHAELRKLKIEVSEKIVRRIMKEEDLKVGIRKTKSTTRIKGKSALSFQMKYRETFIGEESKPIIHTDHGCHYRWFRWISRMESNGYIRSMSKKDEIILKIKALEICIPRFTRRRK